VNTFLLQMHEGESIYLANKWDVIVFVTLLLVVLILIFRNKVPSVSVIREFVEIANTRGGGIILLSFFTWIFFRSAMLFIYHILSMANQTGTTVDKAQAVVTAGLGFVTGSSFGGAFGALLKTMNPPQTEPPISPPSGVQQAETITKTTSTIPPPVLPEPPK
jgi:hypothetical protein